MMEMINKLPMEIQQHIYEYDPTYYEVYDEVVEELEERRKIMKAMEDEGYIVDWIKKNNDDFTTHDYNTSIGRITIFDDEDQLDDYYRMMIKSGDRNIMKEHLQHLRNYSDDELYILQKRLPSELLYKVLLDMMGEPDFSEFLRDISEEQGLAYYDEYEKIIFIHRD